MTFYGIVRHQDGSKTEVGIDYVDSVEEARQAVFGLIPDAACVLLIVK